MTRLAGILGICIFAAAPSVSLAAEPAWKTLETAHYRIQYTCTETDARSLGEWMEFLHKSYSTILKVAPAAEKSKICLFGNRQEFWDFGCPRGAGACYDPGRRLLCGVFESTRVFEEFAHEGTHEFVHAAVPKFMKAVPVWFSEGLADCMASSRIVSGKLHVCLHDARIARSRTAFAKKALLENAKPLRELLELDYGKFLKASDIDVNYSLSWSFVHFLFCYPDPDQPDRIYPAGKYLKAISVFFDEIRKETPGREAWNKALAAIGRTTEQLEAQWKAYVTRTLPEPLSAAEAILGAMTQPHPQGGLEVLGITSGGPAQKGGLVDGDRILSVAGEEIRKHEDLEKVFRKLKAGDEVDLSVARGQEKVAIRIVLSR